MSRVAQLGHSFDWQQTPRNACSIDAKDGDQILHWLLNIKIESLTGKQGVTKVVTHLQTTFEWR